jgi:DNA polymerase-3 subunit delta'
MSIAHFLPWQLQTAQAWLSKRERFAHAWLIHGVAGIGKVEFATAAAASLLCEAPVDHIACGHCAACTWVASDNHPDLRRIRPEAVALAEGGPTAANTDEAAAAGEGATTTKRAPSKEIRIDQLRSLESWFNTATHRGGWRVAVLYPAQALNVISANALLKVLEEPPPNTIFLIVADAPDRLLPTLVSRCRRLPLPAPAADLSLKWLASQGVSSAAEWLAAAGGAPLAALRLSKQGGPACPDYVVTLIESLAKGQTPDIGALAESLEKLAPSVWIDALQRLYADLVLASVGAAVRYFPALSTGIAQTAARADAVKLADGARWLAQQRRVEMHPLNSKLFAHASLQRVVQSCQI